MSPFQANVTASDPGLWEQRVDLLGLRLEGSPVWPFIEKLYEELGAKGIGLRPACYVASEWGCPDGLPLIGIPFYLVDPRMFPYEEEHADDLEDGERILVGLRHEAGHAVNYAYRIYDDPEWQQVFGDFHRPYDDDYLPVPFSPDFVRHLPGAYAQKHPDEDFAETFAVWLTPGSPWREQYAGTGALRKLEYVDRVMARLGATTPAIDPATLTPDPNEVRVTVGQYYSERAQADAPPVEEIGGEVDQDLRELFPAGGIGSDASTLIWDRRRLLMRHVSNYTGARMYVVKAVIFQLIQRLRQLGLRALPGKDADSLLGFTALLSALTMNFLRTRHFVSRQPR